MTSVRRCAPEAHNGVSNSGRELIPEPGSVSVVIASTESRLDRFIPLNLIKKLGIAAAVGGCGTFFPEVSNAVGLGLLAFLVMDQVTRQIR